MKKMLHLILVEKILNVFLHQFVLISYYFLNGFTNQSNYYSIFCSFFLPKIPFISLSSFRHSIVVCICIIIFYKGPNFNNTRIFKFDLFFKNVHCIHKNKYFTPIYLI